MIRLHGIIYYTVFVLYCGCTTTYFTTEFDRDKISRSLIVADVMCERDSSTPHSIVDLEFNRDLGESLSDSLARILTRKGYGPLTVYPCMVGSLMGWALHKREWYDTTDHDLLQKIDDKESIASVNLPLYMPVYSDTEQTLGRGFDAVSGYIASGKRIEDTAFGARKNPPHNLLFVLLLYGFQDSEHFLQWLRLWPLLDRSVLELYVFDIDSGNLLFCNTQEPDYMPPIKHILLGQLEDLVEDLP